MIRYTLACHQGHEFESWFANSDAWDAQVAAGFVSCPVCGSLQVGKTIMAPALARSASHDRQNHQDHEAATASPEPAPATPIVADPEAMRMREAMRAVRQYVLQNTDDVGRNFPAEARRIHAGEAEPRAIRGEADATEVKALVEEGVSILPLPGLPDDLN